MAFFSVGFRKTALKKYLAARERAESAHGRRARLACLTHKAKERAPCSARSTRPSERLPEWEHSERLRAFSEHMLGRIF